jgi:DNA helicase-2/ATP-dependent DNA helicase PcrA
VFEEKLLEAGVPYRIYGGVRFFERREIKDLIAYLQLVANPDNSVALLRVINVPRRGVGDKSLRRIADVADERGVSLRRALGDLIASGEIKGKTAAGLRALMESIEAWRAESAALGLRGLLARVVEETGYLDHLKKSEPLSASTREENIEELARSLEEYDQMNAGGGLTGYLEKIALESAADNYDHDADCVSLMTLHVAKGLEFDVVFIVGMEEPIFPNRRAVEEGRGMEEERRLFYVGLTRARRRVFLCRSQSRFLHGQAQWNIPSSFLAELPPEVLSGDSAPMPRWRPPQKTFAPPARAESAVAFKTGDRVSHQTFGVGTVLGTRGEGALRKLVVRFEGDELVELLEQYAILTPIEGE